MKLTSFLFFIFFITIIFSTPIFADCPTEMEFSKLIDCIAQEDSEPDITDLMSDAADNNMDVATIQDDSIQAKAFVADPIAETAK